MSATPSAAIPDYGWSDGIAEGSHDYLQVPVLGIVDRYGAQIGPRTGGLRVFDAGCGNGALLLPLIKRGYIVAGCDASESGVAEARAQCGEGANIECLSLYENLEERFGGDWDVVISTEVVEHLYSPRDFLQQVLRLLRPGGMLLLSTPYHGYLKNLALAATGKLDAHFTALWDGGHIKFWSRRTLTELLSEFGCESYQFLGVGRLPYLWKSMIVTCRTPI